VPLLRAQAALIEEKGEADVVFVEKAADFFRVYADRTHHGKEEDILFKALGAKSISEDHRRIMGELVEEHAHARAMVGRLLSARGEWLRGDSAALGVIRDMLMGLSDFYPAHIEKEDRRFFMPAMKYFSDEELLAMMSEFNAFDRGMIHWKYQRLLEELGGVVVEAAQGGAESSRYVCSVCGYVYDPVKGDPDRGVAPGTEFADLPEGWVCPICFAPKSEFRRG